MNQDELQYKSETDLGLCSFLVGAGCKVQFIEKHGRQGIFFFELTKEFSDLEKIYWTRSPVSVIPATLFEISKHLKAMAEAQPYETNCNS